MSSFVELLHRDSPGCVDVYQPAAEREGHFSGGRCFSVCAPSSEAPSVRKRCSRQHDGAAPNGAPAALAGFQLLPQMVPGCTLRLAQHNLSAVDDFVNEQVQRLRQIQDWRDGRAVPAVAPAGFMQKLRAILVIALASSACADTPRSGTTYRSGTHLPALDRGCSERSTAGRSHMPVCASALTRAQQRGAVRCCRSGVTYPNPSPIPHKSSPNPTLILP